MQQTQEKAAMRRSAGEARKAAHAAHPDAGAALRDGALASGLVPPGAIVSGYLPIRTEIDPVPLMTALAARGHRVSVPVIEARGCPLKFREWLPGIELVDGPFGASVPAAGEWLEPAFLLVPLLSFDRRGYRLGYGGGFYDRTLERLRSRGPVTACGVAYTAQQVECVPIDATDQRLDAVATEAGVMRIAAAAA